MKNVLLFCTAGMSTSMLVTKMQKYCSEQSIDYRIWAVGSSEVIDEVNKGVDIILLGPQVRYMLDDIKTQVAEKSIPIEVIPSSDYAMMRGDKVVQWIQTLIE